MMNIKPIETVYKGYRFRSRLEARWAVFFDDLGIRWEYEREGFDLGNFGWYLPDFYLLDFRCYLEVKPLSEWDIVHGVFDSSLWDRFRVFADNVEPIVVFGGLPSIGWTGMLFCTDSDDGGGGAYSERVGFALCGIHYHVVLSISDDDRKYLRGDRSLYRTSYFQPWPEMELCRDEDGRRRELLQEVGQACDSARSARFERLETS